MGEREDRVSHGYERQNVPFNPFERMRYFIRERTQGFDQLEIEHFQKFGQINVRINQLDKQVREKRGSIDYFLDSGSQLEINPLRVSLIEAIGWIDLLGRIANGLDTVYFKTSDMQAISAEIAEFAKGRE